MLAQVLEKMFPGEPYTSDGTTWDSVVFENVVKPVDNTLYEYTLDKLTNTDAIKKFREERNTLLNDSDKYMTSDYPHLLEKDIQDWKEYRQALRDLPMTARPTLDADGNLTEKPPDIQLWINTRPVPPTETEIKEKMMAEAEARAKFEAEGS